MTKQKKKVCGKHYKKDQAIGTLSKVAEDDNNENKNTITNSISRCFFLTQH